MCASGKSSIYLTFVGCVEEPNAECLTLPKDSQLVFKAAEAATFGTASEG